MQITRSTDVDTMKGPADWFSGDVYIDAVADPAGSSTFAAVNVHFTPGARTAWHTHPHGQPVSVTEGAAPNRFMVHIGMQQTDENGNPFTWGEHVTGEQYNATPGS